jgi:uncharacterized SAM-binding protein YcdF (DUF218 family)
MPSRAKSFFDSLLWICGAAFSVAICLVLWGSNLLIVDSPSPSHVDAAVVLQGSMVAETARINKSASLLRSGTSDRILISLPRESYWGQSLPPIARNYIERNYGLEVAAKTDFCETGPEVDSTRQEAQAVIACIRQHGWKSVAIVTSEYHTRRAGFIWARMIRSQDVKVWIEGVADPDFQRQWWRGRHSAKTFVMELSKLLWAVTAER